MRRINYPPLIQIKLPFANHYQYAPMMIGPIFFEKELPSLQLALERFFVRYRPVLGWLHLLMFLFFATVIILPLLLPEASERAGMFDDFSVFARELIWTLWFPLVFMSVIFSGRSWCGLLCPMGAASEWVNKRGLKRKVPQWIEWSGTPIISFLIITIWGQLIGVRDHAEGIAWVFGITMLAAVFVGYVWGYHKRVWCRHLCPIGLMLGVFSRLGMVTFTPKRPREGVEQVTDKTACPTRIALPYKTESRHCIACFRCVSPCAKGGLSLEFRPAGQEIAQISKRNPNAAEVMFLFLGTGIALGGFMWTTLPSYQHLRQAIGQWILQHEWLWLLTSGPSWLVSVHPEKREVFLWMDAVLISGYMLGWMLLVALFMAGVTWIITRMTHSIALQAPFRQRYIEIGYHLIPVAMVSLLIGLGSNLFSMMEAHWVGETFTTGLKLILILGSVAWGVSLCRTILSAQKAATTASAIGVSLVGNLLIAGCWWPALF